MMQLLGSTPSVVFDRVYAYENAYLSYLLALSRVPLEGVRTNDVWRRAAVDVEDFIARQGVVGGFPWAPSPSITSGGDGLDDELFAACWDVYARRAQLDAKELGGPSTESKYYAETAPMWVADRVQCLGGRTIVLVRDPRDQFLSILSFNAKRGRLSFGVKADDTPQSYALRFVERQKAYLERAIDPGNPHQCAVVRFEDLTERRERTAAETVRLARGHALDPCRGRPSTGAQDLIRSRELPVEDRDDARGARDLQRASPRTHRHPWLGLGRSCCGVYADVRVGPCCSAPGMS